MKKLSVIVITRNEEKNIRDCLESVRWADEIIVVDARSSDATAELCKEFTERIFVRDWPGFAAQKQFALDQAKFDWVLSIDADERATPALQRDIRTVLSDENEAPDGYYIPRLSYFLGKKIMHSGWYPGYQLRLFRRDRTKVSASRVHEGFLVDGRVGYLQNDLLHFTHPSVEESLNRMNRYSSLEALDRFERKKTKQVRWYDFIIHPFSAFARQFFVHQGFRDGIQGFILALISGTVKMALYMKLWELQRKR
ncbi:MAG: glycosyltransferase family 2 protein [Candidatus Zhuqueibacterota bacterium]